MNLRESPIVLGTTATVGPLTMITKFELVPSYLISPANLKPEFHGAPILRLFHWHVTSNKKGWELWLCGSLRLLNTIKDLPTGNPTAFLSSDVEHPFTGRHFEKLLRLKNENGVASSNCMVSTLNSPLLVHSKHQ